MKFLDLFAGIGGFRLGMEMAGHECVGHCEIDKFANASYMAMHNPKEDEWFADDITRVRAVDIPRADCWCFGFPCQDISVAGKQGGFTSGKRSSLFFTVTGLIRDLEEKDRPSVLFIENVKNLLSINRGFDFAKLLIELDEIGYDAEWQVLNSKNFGVPQNRERVFVIGHLRGRGRRKVFPVCGTDGETAINIDDKFVVGGLYTNVSKDFNRGVLPDCSRCLKGNKHDAGIVFIGLNASGAITENARPLQARYKKGIKNHKGECSGIYDGANFLVPEDVDTAIRELRKSYVSAKELITVIPTSALAGSYTFESGAPAGLTPFEDNGDEIEEETNPTFTQKKWAIKFKGKIFPVSNILLGAEKAGLVSYLNNWFVKSAIVSENKDIFDTLKDGKTAKALKGLDALKASINTDLDPSALIGGVIVTNQTGFNIMDGETDAVGRPILERDMKNPTQKLFQGLPIKVFPDAQLANISAGKAPIFYGSLTAGAFMIDKEGLEFATSEHVFFKKNQLAMRVIEGYDVIQADGNAYCYGALTAADDKAVNRYLVLGVVYNG